MDNDILADLQLPSNHDRNHSKDNDRPTLSSFFEGIFGGGSQKGQSSEMNNELKKPTPERGDNKGQPKPGGVKHTVKRGDTLSQIAQQYLGSSKRWREIYNANRDVLKSPSQMRLGMVLTIPQGDAGPTKDEKTKPKAEKDSKGSPKSKKDEPKEETPKGTSGVTYKNQSSTRSKPVQALLMQRISHAIQKVYGQGARAEIYSGGQAKKGTPGKRTGSIRHDDGYAADCYIYVDGKRLTTLSKLKPLKEFWISSGYGSVGLVMSGGGIHLDLWGGTGGPALGKGMSITWRY
ncbi:LysM peptidoglycan-binding domain-containing protein [Myxococcota bacterium]|nr:LysM peptidoglycan-binding domain-containing protein [Myxococcota bacterium]MBU1431871.1 LysM peptidoglycan-binding domain-containing protein [Myxococcota bacterium]MBU1898021.1 LysM peptidoglycan-binding domain-containing protein [Myxococcota bacterium]